MICICIYNYYILYIRIRKESVWRWEFGIPGLLELRAEILGLSAAPAGLEVSQNGGYPKIDGLQWKIHQWMIWRYPDFRKPPYTVFV